MKTKRLPNKYEKHFAWFPVWLTHGDKDSGRYAWLETVFWKNAYVGHGMGANIQAVSKRDHEYNQQLLFEMRMNPDRYGNDPYRSIE
jgi:hypothetical protein